MGGYTHSNLNTKDLEAFPETIWMRDFPLLPGCRAIWKEKK